MATDSDAQWIPYVFALLQSIIIAVLGYISKLLWNIRDEISAVRLKVKEHDVRLDEGEKRDELREHEVDRRLDRLERKP